MGTGHNTRNDWMRVFALALAILFVGFVGTGLNHTHAKGQTEATCQVCQAAHITSAPAEQALSLFSPFIATEYVQPFVVTIHQEFFFHDSPSRAPPTA
jgi:hypothetical protein